MGQFIRSRRSCMSRTRCGAGVLHRDPGLPDAIPAAGLCLCRTQGLRLRILENDPADCPATVATPHIDVRDVDALHAELKPRLDTLPAGDVHGPADKPCRQRELLVRAPHGNLIAFGQSIAPAAGSS